MIALRAASVPTSPDVQRLLVVDSATGEVSSTSARQLPQLLRAGDLVVLNDAATLPASLPVQAPSGRIHELRIAIPGGPEGWWGVLFGEGDWHSPTEHRPAPDSLTVGERLVLPDGSHAVVHAVSPRSPRLLRLHWGRNDDAVLALLYRYGAPVQYSYLGRALQLHEVQTPFGTHPWAVEMPSASRPLDWAALGHLRRRGVELAILTHAAGLSATGDEDLDAQLPLPERYRIGAATIDAIARTRARGGRILAVGTTVVRALEGNALAHGGKPTATEGVTDLVISEGFVPRVVDGLLSGVHEPGTSHHYVVSAFAPPATIAAADAHALREELLVHEFGDATLLLPDIASRQHQAA